MTSTTAPPKASDKQVSFIQSLLDERDLFKSDRFFDSVNAMDATELADYIERLKEQANRLNKTVASAWISALLDLPKKGKAEPSNNGRSAPRFSEPEAGMYRTEDGNIYRVYLGQKSGRMLVKQVVGDEASGYGYEYVGAAQYKLPQDAERMTLAEAKEWGKMTGHCCVCARRLDVPESVDAGIGPVCAGRVGDGR